MPLSISIAELSANAAPLNNLFHRAPLLAGRGESGEMVLWLVIFGIFIGTVCGVAFLSTHYLNRRRYNSHPALFYALCGVHDLDRNTRAMLKQVVRHYALTQPALVFIDPHWLDPARLGEPFASKAEQLLALRKQLFAIDKNADS